MPTGKVNKSGRPKKTLDDLPQDWEQIILDLKKEGGSDVECRVALDMSDDLWYRLINDEVKFSRTIKKGQDLCQAWWLGAGRTGMYQKNGETNLNPTLWYMNMKNRFGWKDKQEIQANVSGNITVNIKTKRDGTK